MLEPISTPIKLYMNPPKRTERERRHYDRHSARNDGVDNLDNLDQQESERSIDTHSIQQRFKTAFSFKEACPIDPNA